MSSSFKRLSWVTVAVLAVVGLPDTAAAQYGGGNKKPSGYGKNPGLEKKNSWRRDTGSGEADTPVEFKRGEIKLGQKAKGELAGPGSTATIGFAAPRGAKLRLSVAFTGTVGDTTVGLAKSGGAIVASFRSTGATFRLTDFETALTDVYAISIVHAGKGELKFLASTSAELPEGVDSSFDLAPSKTASIQLDGFPGRSIKSISIVPADSTERLGFKLWLKDDAGGAELAKLDAAGITAGDPTVALERKLSLGSRDSYRLDLRLEDAIDKDSKQSVIVRVDYQNPPLATGTVTLRATL